MFHSASRWRCLPDCSPREALEGQACSACPDLKSNVCGKQPPLQAESDFLRRMVGRVGCCALYRRRRHRSVARDRGGCSSLTAQIWTWIVAAVLLLGGLYHLGLFRVPMPQMHRQVPRHWMFRWSLTWVAVGYECPARLRRGDAHYQLCDLRCAGCGDVDWEPYPRRSHNDGIRLCKSASCRSRRTFRVFPQSLPRACCPP